jgi:hypothetical protein
VNWVPRRQRLSARGVLIRTPGPAANGTAVVRRPRPTITVSREHPCALSRRQADRSGIPSGSPAKIISRVFPSAPSQQRLLRPNPHRACCNRRCPLSAISCLGASRTPAVGARGWPRHAGVRETCTRADIHRAAPEPPQSKPPRRFGPIEADDGSSSEAVPDRRTGRATVVHPITHRRKRVPYPAAAGRWRSALGERVGFKGPSTPSDNSLPLRRCETGIPDGSKIVCIAMAATTFVARSA